MFLCCCWKFTVSLTDELIAEQNLHILQQSSSQTDKLLCWTSYRLRRMNEKSVNWKRSCWKRSATWRRGRRRLWRLLQTAQQNTFRTCRTNSSVSNWTSRKRTLGFSKRNWNEKATGFEQTGFFLPFVRLAEASDITSSNFTLYEDRLRQPEEPGSKFLRVLWSSYQRSKKAGMWCLENYV